MSRPLRIQFPGAVYHLVNRCGARQATFLGDNDYKALSPLALRSDQATPLLFQSLFARERCYLALEPYFPYRNGRLKAAPVLEEYQTVRHRNGAMVCS
jgi:hypothetical protein